MSRFSSIVIIWGNHSATQFPDVKHATVLVGNVEKSVYDAIGDNNYLQTDFVTTIQKRGAAVIAARKMSSAMSAAKAATDHMHDWYILEEKHFYGIFVNYRLFSFQIGGTAQKKGNGFRWESFQMAAMECQRTSFTLSQCR